MTTRNTQNSREAKEESGGTSEGLKPNKNKKNNQINFLDGM